jgi:hypothetical protein
LAKLYKRRSVIFPAQITFIVATQRRGEMEISMKLEFLFYNNREVAVRQETQAPLEDAELFGEILIFCCVLQYALSWARGTNADVILELLAYGHQLDELLNTQPHDYHHLIAEPQPDPRITLLVDLSFSLDDVEKWKVSFKPKVIWREALWEESALILLRYLTRRRGSNSHFVSVLKDAIATSTKAYRTKKFKREDHALEIANSVSAEYVRAMARAYMKAQGLPDEVIDENIELLEMMADAGLTMDDLRKFEEQWKVP